jgi:hypothetical protein
VPEPVEDFEFTVVATDAIAPDLRALVIDLFGRCYKDGDRGYLEQSFSKLGYLATARRGDELAGFAVGDMRILDLPRLPRQPVALAGICCVDARFRRLGLFRALESRTFLAPGVDWRPRLLSCGRMAHPVSFRTMLDNPTHLPKRGVAPTPWQRDVAASIASAYGVADFDPATFVCRGRGTPMSAVLDVDVAKEEWEVFAPVDRSRGDSLLGMIWIPDAPEGW